MVLLGRNLEDYLYQWGYKMKQIIPFLLIAVIVASCSKKNTNIDLIQEPIVRAEAVKEEPFVILTDKPQNKESNKEVRLYTVYFDFDSYELKRSAMSFLDGLKQNVLLGGEVVTLSGGCCPIGDDDYNYDLGIKRAVSVSEYLDVDAVVKSVGEDEEYLITNAHENYWKNRRCEIRIER